MELPSFKQQFYTLLKRNLKLKKRNRNSTLYEILYPLYMIGILVIVKIAVGENVGLVYPAESFQPAPVASAGIIGMNTVLVCPADNASMAFVGAALETGMGVDFPFPLTTIGFDTPDEMVQWHHDSAATYNGTVMAGVVLERSIDEMLGDGRGNFTIRVVSSMAPPTTVWPMDYGLGSCRGSHGNSNRTACTSDMWFTYSPFLAVEWALGTQFAAALGSSDSVAFSPLLTIQQFPVDETFVPPIPTTLDTLVPLYLSLSFFPLVQYLMTNIVAEKEKQRKVYLRILGTRTSAFWAAWGVVYLGSVLITITLLTILTTASSLIANVSPGLLFVAMAFFGSSLIGLGFALSAFFSKAKTAGLAGMFIMLAMSMSFFLVQDAGPAVKHVLSLMSPVAIMLSLRTVTDASAVGASITGANSFTVYNGWSFGAGIVYLAVDTVLYFALSWYLDLVVPKEYGVTKPWYFLFQASTWRRTPRGGDSQLPNLSDAETSSVGEKTGLLVSHVTKVFPATRSSKKETVANNDITFSARDGEIIGLLGHNGSGKSTLVSCLVGLHQPTSGTASLYNLSIEEDMDSIRARTGFVPQTNDHLHEELTCLEHMELVAGIKGIIIDGPAILASVGLVPASQQQTAKALSGGQKRKLCLAMALASKPALLILDEHSAGVDVLARRQLWKLLQQSREERVTLVASHFLDELEALCDRIVLMDRGTVRSTSTALALKAEFNISYTLTVVADPDDHVRLLAAVQTHVADAELDQQEEEGGEKPKEDGGDDGDGKRGKGRKGRTKGKKKGGEVGGLASSRDASDAPGDGHRQLRISLPLSAMPVFPDVFRTLEEDKAVDSLGLELPTLEQVFIAMERDKVHDPADEATSAREAAAASGTGSSTPATGLLESSDPARIPLQEPGEAAPEVPASVQIRALYKALVRARFRQGPYWLCTVVFPSIFAIVALIVATLSGDAASLQRAAEQPLAFNSSFVPLADALAAAGLPHSDLRTDFVFADPDGNTTWLADVARDHWPVDTQVVDSIDDAYQIVVPSAFFAVNVSGAPGTADPVLAGDIVLHANFSYPRALPEAVRSFADGLSRYASGNKTSSVSLSLLPFPSDSPVFDGSAFTAGILLCIAFTFGAASPAIALVKARSVGFDHMLRLGGASRRIFWIASLASDLPAILSVAIVSTIMVLILQVTAFTGPALLPFLLGAVLYSILVVLQSYVFSFAFSDPEAVEKVLPGIMQLFSYLPFPALFIVSTFTSAATTTLVNALVLVFIPLAAMPSLLTFLLRLDLAVQLGFVPADSVTVSTYFELDNNVVPALLAMVGHIALSTAIIYYLDVVRVGRATKKLRNSPEVAKLVTEHAERSDVDVVAEAERVARVAASFGGGAADESTSGRPSHIVVQDLIVAYENAEGEEKVKAAVKAVSFAVDEGQRVALLGPNGAGKTSLMSMVVGVVPAASGKAFIAGHDVDRERSDAFRNLGFTAQHDQCMESLKMREHLELFATLAGASEHDAARTAAAAMQRLGIAEHAEKQVKELSGGTKRKLSLAIGTIGSPRAQLLDEPSAGVDVFAQQQIWGVIREHGSHSSLIVSTHSMSEASSLCNVVVVMTSGRVQCIGTPQHLLDRFGTAFMLEVVSDASTARAVDRFVRILFPDARLQDSFGGRSRYHVLSSEPHATDVNAIVDQVTGWTGEALHSDEALFVGLGEADDEPANTDGTTNGRITPSFATVFEAFGRVKEHLQIADFAFAQPTLEQIFNKFAADDSLANMADAK
jgi:ABC-type multidrug transport system ATPase subunit